MELILKVNFFFVALWFCFVLCQACNIDEFQCTNGICIKSKYKCDTDDDCGDRSDESNLLCTNCSDEEFHCRGIRTCIPLTSICNGVNDCGDDTDEFHCNGGCADNYFVCDGGTRCVEKRQKCDGIPQCDDKIDEIGCPVTTTLRSTVPVTIRRTSNAITTKKRNKVSTAIFPLDSTTTTNNYRAYETSNSSNYASAKLTGDQPANKLQDHSITVAIVVVVGIVLITIVIIFGTIFAINKKNKNSEIRPHSFISVFSANPRSSNSYSNPFYSKSVTPYERQSNSGIYDDIDVASTSNACGGLDDTYLKPVKCDDSYDGIYSTINADFDETYDDTK